MKTNIVGLQPMAQRKNRLQTMLLLLFVLAGNMLIAQKTYFVYLQSDNQQPFFVNINGKNISSSAMGYVILSKLHDSTYPIKIGFPAGGSLQEFDLAVNGNDQGFLVKDFGEKGYGLFNMQSLSLVMNTNGAAKEKAADEQNKAENNKRIADSTAAAAMALAQKQKADSIAQAAELKKADSLKAATAAQLKAQKDTLAQASTTAATTISPAVVAVTSKPVDEKKEITTKVSKDTARQVASADSVKPAVAASPVKNATDSTFVAAGKTLVADSTKLATGTIITKPAADSTTKPVTATPSTATTSSAGGKTAGNSPRFLDMELHSDSAELVQVKPATDSVKAKPAANTITGKEATSSPVAATQTKGSITSNNSNTTVVTTPEVTTSAAGKASQQTNGACKKIASEKDFFSLRKKMAATEDVGEMILTAKTAFREKCYTNEQLRNLCVLFLDDAARYRFLDEAYAYSSDPQAYKQLANLLKDEYYLRRFSSMLH